MFKERTTKKRLGNQEGCSNGTLTLDARHRQVIDDIQNEYSKLTDLQSQADSIKRDITKYEDHIAKLRSKINDGVVIDTKKYDAIWNNLMTSKDSLRTIEERIKKINKCEEEIEYFANTGDILFKYYDIIDKQSSIGVSMPIDFPKPTTSFKQKMKDISNVGTKSVLESLGLLVIHDNENTTNDRCVTEKGVTETGIVSAGSTVGGSSTKPALNGGKTGGLDEIRADNKSELIDKYLAMVDPVHVRTVNDMDANVEICTECNKQMVCMYHEGIMYCTTCGYQELLLVEQNKPVYRQPVKDASHLSYKRINHFNEWILQCQGKESTDIPDEIFDKILLEVKKDKITDTWNY